jgi:hypothetical protein
MLVGNLGTPALVIDLDTMERNLRRAAESSVRIRRRIRFRRSGGANLNPAGGSCGRHGCCETRARCGQSTLLPINRLSDHPEHSSRDGDS